MVAFVLGTAAIIVVSLVLRITMDELVVRWANGVLDNPRSLQGS
ncbi:hypothetical protein SAMN02927895_05525 [Belnapia rosea]|nr:hypothetical protein SAMN02927895_05525 [Belnapia rosea]